MGREARGQGILRKRQRIDIGAVELRARRIHAAAVVEDFRLDVGPDAAMVDERACEVVEAVLADHPRARPAVQDGAVADDPAALREVGEPAAANNLIDTLALGGIPDRLRDGARLLLHWLE